MAVWVVIGLLLILLFNLFQGSASRGPQSDVIYSEFLDRVKQGTVVSVTIQGPNITGRMKDGSSFATYAPNDPNLIADLKDKQVQINAAPADDSMHPLLNIL